MCVFLCFSKASLAKVYFILNSVSSEFFFFFFCFCLFFKPYAVDIEIFCLFFLLVGRKAPAKRVQFEIGKNQKSKDLVH